MKKEEKNTILANISNLKKELMLMRVKASSGEVVAVKELKIKRKEIARLFTKLNNKKAAA